MEEEELKTKLRLKRREDWHKKVRNKPELYRKLSRQGFMRHYWKHHEEHRLKRKQRTERDREKLLLERMLVCSLTQRWSTQDVARCVGSAVKTIRKLERACIIPKTDEDIAGERSYTVARVAFLTRAIDKFEKTMYDTKRVEKQFLLEDMKEFLLKWWDRSLDEFIAEELKGDEYGE